MVSAPDLKSNARRSEFVHAEVHVVKRIPRDPGRPCIRTGAFPPPGSRTVVTPVPSDDMRFSANFVDVYTMVPSSSHAAPPKNTESASLDGDPPAIGSFHRAVFRTIAIHCPSGDIVKYSTLSAPGRGEGSYRSRSLTHS